MACPRVVALRVTLAISDLGDPTIAEDEPLSEAGVSDSVDAQIQGDVVRVEGFGQSMVLELDLSRCHCWVSTVIVGEVDNAVAKLLGGTELPVVVVTEDDVCVVAGREATRWRQERRDKFWFGDRSGDDDRMKASFMWGPQFFHLKERSK